MDTIYCAAFESDLEELKPHAADADRADRKAPERPCAKRPPADPTDIWYNEAAVRDADDARLRPLY